MRSDFLTITSAGDVHHGRIYPRLISGAALASYTEHDCSCCVVGDLAMRLKFPGKLGPQFSVYVLDLSI